MPFWKQDKSLTELEEEEERLRAKQRVVKTQREIREEEATIQEINERMGGKGIRGSIVKMFSNNGKRSGFSLDRAKQWLKNH